MKSSVEERLMPGPGAARRSLVVAALLLAAAACAELQAPPHPGDTAGKRFEAVPDKAVIYLVRHPLDSNIPTSILLDDQMIGSTYRGTYVRIVVPGGKHRISGFGADSARIDLQTEPGKIYFVRQTTWMVRGSLGGSVFQAVDPGTGHSLVAAGTMSSEVAW